jgi:hypothetical protein
VIALNNSRWSVNYPGIDATIAVSLLPDNIIDESQNLRKIFNRNKQENSQFNYSMTVKKDNGPANIVDRIDDRIFDEIVIPDKKSVTDYLTRNSDLVKTLKRVLIKAHELKVPLKNLTLYKKFDREEKDLEFLQLNINFYEDFIETHLDMIDDLTNFISQDLLKSSSLLVISANYHC